MGGLINPQTLQGRTSAGVFAAFAFGLMAAVGMQPAPAPAAQSAPGLAAAPPKPMSSSIASDSMSPDMSPNASK